MQTDWGQNWLARKVTTRLSKDLQSRINIDHVQIGLFNKMNLNGVLVEDRKKDTLLYAGTVQVRITDWFFLKDKAVLHYIGLENALINFNRTDSVWNYQFLADYFAPPSTGKKKQSGIEFNLKRVIMNNVAFNQKDAWRGENLVARVDELDLDANDISITNKNIDVTSIDLVKPYFQLYSYTGNRPKTLTKQNKKVVADTALQWNPENWTIAFDRITIDDGTLRTDRKTLTPTIASFDGEHIQLTELDGRINHFKLASDTLRANINLAAKERSGLLVQSLKTDFRLHPKLMEFDNLYLKTNKSVLGHYFAMKYKNLGDMNDFIHAVTMEAHFDNSSLASDDIAFFAPDIKDWNRTVKIDGRVRGTVDDLNGSNVSLQMGKSTSLRGDFSLVGLPDINTTLINVTANDLRTTYADAVTFIPSLKSITTPNLKKLNNIRFTGTYTGFINDFVTYGTLQTSLGTLVTDLNMKFPKGGTPVYSGEISTDNFQLGQFINNSQLGAVAFNGNVKGRSFEWKTLDMDINGTVRRLHFNQYTYQNITAKGKLKNRMFNGDFVINDPNADLKLTGLINLSGRVPTFDAVASVNHLNLQALKLTEEEITLAGDFNVNFSGANIADFLGTARIANATLMQNGQRLSFDSLLVSSSYTNGIRTLRARSNEFDATVTGRFDLHSLPNAVVLFLNRYYPSYIRPPRRQVANQSFTFDVTTGVVEDYVKLFDNRLSGFNNSHVSGSLDMATNSLTLDADVPQASFEQYSFSDVQLKGDGNFERLIVTGQVNNAVVSDSLVFPQTTFSITARNDISDIEINTTANQTLNQANISAQIKTFRDGATVLFNPSSFVLNGKTWSIEQGGELDFRRNSIVQGQLMVKESNQEIRISTHPSPIGNWSDLHIALQNINIGDFTPFFVKSNRIEGLLHGDIVIEDPQNRFNVFAENIRTEQLRVDNDSIGEVEASLAYNNNTGILVGRGNNLDPEHKVNFDLALNLKDSANAYRDRISIGAENFQVKVLERFLGTLFSNMEGYVTGNLDILGEGANRKYIGKARLRDAGMKINFTQVFYKLDDTEIELTEDEIRLGTIKLRDRRNRTATVTGTIRHSNFQNMYFDILAEVDNRPMELINTSYNDNQQFYGRATGTGSFVLVGPQHDMYMEVNARASEQDSSYITLPPSRTRETGAASFMIERKYGREMTEQEFRGAATNIAYEVNLTANPMVNIEVILDDLTGDVIKGRGTGNLRLNAGTSEPLSINGRFDIQEGDYLFTLQTIFKKPFKLQGVNNFIEWNGDPYDARINLNARYEANQVSLAPLVSSLSMTNNQNIANTRTDVNVIVNLTGELFRPTFTFDIEFPQNYYSSIDPQTAFALQQSIQQIEKNTNELNKQVAFLIVSNSFAPYEGTQGSAFNPLNEFAYSTISGLLFGEINKRLNQLLGRILQNSDLRLNFTGSLYNRDVLTQGSSAFRINQSNLNINVSGPIFTERVILTLGGSADVGITGTIEERIQLFPDVTVEFLINKSGSVRATFFYRQTPDLVSGAGAGINRGTQRAGANLAYRKDFRSFGEFLLGRKKGKPKGQLKDSGTAPVPDTSRTVDTTNKNSQ